MPRNLSRLELSELSERTLSLIRETGILTRHTCMMPPALAPLSRLLAGNAPITTRQLSACLDRIFDGLHDHPLTRKSRRVTEYLRRKDLLPNEKSTEALIRYVVEQMVLRSPLAVPEKVVDEFWTFFEELFAAPELKGLMELNFEMLRLILRTYEPLIVDIVNILKETGNLARINMGALLEHLKVIPGDLAILKRQIRALRYVKPFFRTDPRDFRTQAQIVARMVREFGPFFMKLAQVAAAGSNFLPEEISRELLVFQEDVPPMGAGEVQAAFQECYGKLPHECYFGFDPARPLKSGSIGSVYVAKKPVQMDGKEILVPVVVKIGRYGLDREFLMGKTALGLTLLSTQYWAPHSKLAPFLETMQQQADEFIKGFERELNFETEAQIQQRFLRRSRNSRHWRVPQLFRSSPRILEMEYIEGGVSIHRALELVPPSRRNGYARSIASRFLYTILLHILAYQEFHGDLHPGNVILDPEGELYLIDWGNCVNLEGKWKPLWDYAAGALAGNVELLTDALIHISSDPGRNAARRSHIRDCLQETLAKKKAPPLTRYFAYQLWREGTPGLHRRMQVVIHLMSNTQHLGVVVQSDYLHLSRSLAALAATYLKLYEDLPGPIMAYDFFKTLLQFPFEFAKDRLETRAGHFRAQVLKHLRLRKINRRPAFLRPSFLKPKLSDF